MGKYLIFIGFLLITPFFHTGEAKIDTMLHPDQIDTLRIAMEDEFIEGSIYQDNSYNGQLWTSAVYLSLIKRAPSTLAGWDPYAASDLPEVSQDYMDYTFTIRNGLKFSNGQDVTPNDVAYSLALAASPNSIGHSQYTYHLNSSSIQILNSTSFTISYDNLVDFPYSLLDFPIVASGTTTISGGPFKLESLSTSTVVLTPNPFYYNVSEVFIDKLVFEHIDSKEDALTALQQGTVDVLDWLYNFNPSDIDSDPSISIFEGIRPEYQEVGINQLHPFFGTGDSIPGNGAATELEKLDDAKLVRQAMSYVFDRANIENNISDGILVAANSLAPSSSHNHNTNLPIRYYNLTKSRELMVQAGFDYADLGIEFSNQTFENTFFDLTLLVPNSQPERNLYVEQFAEDLRKIGIGVKKIDSRPVTEAGFRSFLYNGNGLPPLYDDGGYDLSFIGYTFSIDWNPLKQYTGDGVCGSYCSNWYNFDIYENQTDVAITYDQYISAYDPILRQQKSHELQSLLYDYLPAIPIGYQINLIPTSADVTGIDATGYLLRYHDWEKITKVGFTKNSEIHIIGSAELKDSEDGIVVDMAWTIFSVVNGTYSLYQNQTEISNGNWNSGEEVDFTYTDLAVNTYNFTLQAINDIGGISEHTVIVVIDSDDADNSNEDDSPLYFVPALVIITSWIYVVRRRRHFSS